MEQAGLTSDMNPQLSYGSIDTSLQPKQFSLMSSNIWLIKAYFSLKILWAYFNDNGVSGILIDVALTNEDINKDFFWIS